MKLLIVTSPMGFKENDPFKGLQGAKEYEAKAPSHNTEGPYAELQVLKKYSGEKAVDMVLSLSPEKAAVLSYALNQVSSRWENFHDSRDEEAVEQFVAADAATEKAAAKKTCSFDRRLSEVYEARTCNRALICFFCGPAVCCTDSFNMSQDHLIKLACSKCKRINYWSTRNRKQVERKIDLKKYCNWCRAHLQHKEAKK